MLTEKFEVYYSFPLRDGNKKSEMLQSFHFKYLKAIGPYIFKVV